MPNDQLQQMTETQQQIQTNIALIQGQLVQMQEQFMQMQGQFAQMQLTQLAAIRNAMARSRNLVIGSDDPLAPLVREVNAMGPLPLPQPNDPPPADFPDTAEQCRHLLAAQLNALQNYYGIPLDGNLNQRRKAFMNYIGVR